MKKESLYERRIKEIEEEFKDVQNNKWNEIFTSFKAIPFDVFYRMDREQIINFFKDRTIPK